jgi:V/A-type H+-transporting ATPase subunit C
MTEYCVARVRGMRARLLGRRGLADLAAQPDLAARLDLLRRTGHARPGTTTLRQAARDLRRELAADTARVVGWLGGGREAKQLRALAAVHDGWTLKTLLRGLERGEPSARILDLVAPTLDLDEGALRELVAQRSARGVVDLLTTWGSPVAAPLAEAIPDPAHVDVAALEVALDRFLVARAVAAARGAVAAYVARLVDLTNATTLLAIAGRPVDGHLFLDGGVELPRARLEELAGLGTLEAHAAIAAHRRLGLGPAFVDGKVDPFLLERVAERRLIAPLRREARERPLSVATPLLYLLERRAELRAIRLVLEAAELGLPPGEAMALVEMGI